MKNLILNTYLELPINIISEMRMMWHDMRQSCG